MYSEGLTFSLIPNVSFSRPQILNRMPTLVDTKTTIKTKLVNHKLLHINAGAVLFFENRMHCLLTMRRFAFLWPRHPAVFGFLKILRTDALLMPWQSVKGGGDQGTNWFPLSSVYRPKLPKNKKKHF